MAKRKPKRKLKSKATTIAPGVRYYGPSKLRPGTAYKRGGKYGGRYDPKKKHKFVGAEEKKAMLRAGLPKKQPKIKMSPGFQAKYQEAIDKGLDTQPGKIPETGKKSFWQKTKGAWKKGAEEAKITPKEQEAITESWTATGERFEKSMEEMPRVLEKGAKAAAIGSAIGLTIGTAIGLFRTLPPGKELMYGEQMRAPVPSDWAAGAATNAKSAGLIGNAVTGGSTWAIGGTMVGAGVIGSMVWGMYAGAESPESPNIMVREVVTNAESTGDLTLLKELFEPGPNGEKSYMESIKDLYEKADPTKLENQLPGWGIGQESINKFKGNKLGFEILYKYAKHIYESSETGEDPHMIYLREKEESEMRIAVFIDELTRARNEAGLQGQRDIMAIEAELQKQNQEFWMEYLKRKYELMENYGKSTLGFGLL